MYLLRATRQLDFGASENATAAFADWIILQAENAGVERLYKR